MFMISRLALSPAVPAFLYLSLFLSSCGFERIQLPSPYAFSSGDAVPEEYSFEDTALTANALDIATIQQFNQKSQVSNTAQPDLSAIADTQIVHRVAEPNQNSLVTSKPQLAARTVTRQINVNNTGATVESVAVEIANLKARASKSVQDLYSRRGNKPLWRNGNQWINMASAVKTSLINSEHEGLPARRYLKFGNFQTSKAQTAKQIAEADLALTAASMSYLVDLSDGLDPEKRQANGTQRLLVALRNGNWKTYTASLKPKNKQYLGLSHVMRSGALTDDQKKTVMINMERFRAYNEPTDSRFIHVNLPTQSLTGYDQSRPSIDMPVVIGQLSRQTPVMTDRITNLKFSPDWSVPQSIAKKDIFPILKQKGSALTKSMNLKIFKGSRQVDPDKEDWSKAKSSSYRFYQPSGPGNALGGVRFSLTNPRGIYLHDTPSRDLFSRATRVVSSGCVRVGDAEGLATWLMQDTEWNRSKVQKAMKRGKTQIVNLRKDVPVYFTYHTAHVDAQGRFQMGADIYALDAALGIRLGIF